MHETIREPIDWAARRRERAAAREAGKFYKRPWFIGAVAAAVLLTAVIGTEVATSYGKVHPGVTVADIEIGGKRPSQARAVLEAQLPAKTEEPIVVEHEDKSWTYTAAELGIDFDYTGLVREAMSVGRSGGAGSMLTGRISSWFGGVEIEALPIADEALVKKALDDIAMGTDVAPVDADVKMTGTKAEVIASADGVALDRSAAENAMLAAFMSAERTVAAPVTTAPVAITDEEAEKAAQLAEKMASEAVKVTYEGKSWTFAPEKVAGWLSFVRSDEETAGADSPVVDPSDTPDASKGAVSLLVKVDPEFVGKTVIPTIGADIGREATNAKFTTANGKVTIVPSQDGIGPDIDSLAISLTDKLSRDESREVELRTTRTEPEITTEKARTMGIKERIGTFTTTFDASNKPRVNNIHLLGNSLDGKLIPPGSTFSFNGAIGERTAAKGYKEANAIINGKLVPSLGGGICQVTTTLFNAVFESGLPVTERRNHSFYISSYPAGRDATVSWGGPDFKFRNDTDNWVLISVAYSASSVTVSLYGTDPGYEVSANTSATTAGAAFPTEEIKDATLAQGSRVVESAGVNGRSITVTRTVKKDGKVLRTDNFVSNYKPKTQIVRVGTKAPVEASASTTATPTR